MTVFDGAIFVIKATETRITFCTPDIEIGIIVFGIPHET